MVDKSNLKEIDWRYKNNLLGSLLLSSTLNGNYKFPTIEEFILSEVMNGTIEYIGGKAGQIDYKMMEFDKNSFEKKLNECFLIEIKKNSNKKLNPRLKKALIDLCKPQIVCPKGPNKPYIHTELYSHLRNLSEFGFCFPNMNSSFYLPTEIINEIQNLKNIQISDSEKADVEGIGKVMRKYIDKDLEFIKQTYYW